jgi:hypothetical protein
VVAAKREEICTKGLHSLRQVDFARRRLNVDGLARLLEDGHPAFDSSMSNRAVIPYGPQKPYGAVGNKISINLMRCAHSSEPRELHQKAFNPETWGMVRLSVETW